MKRVRVVVQGEVQGVFFRDTVRSAAADNGVAGWVRNHPNGSVEAVLEGTEDAVNAVVAVCRKGPPSARVGEVELTAEEPEGLEGFEVR